MEHFRHIIRIAMLLIFGIASLAIARSFLIPESFGHFGYYRADNVAEQRDHPVLHGGPDSCRSCHAERDKELKGQKHATVPCESCHGPLSTHVKDNAKIAPMTRDATASLCLRCHLKLKGRPAFIKQVEPQAHVAKQGADWSSEVCIVCHNVHAPAMEN
jgi:hypothetical protein